METTIKVKMIKDTHYEMSVENEKETEKAIYTRIFSGIANKLIWIPKSVIKEEENCFVIPMWFVNQNLKNI